MAAKTMSVTTSMIRQTTALLHPFDIFLQAQQYRMNEPIEVPEAPMMNEFRGMFPSLEFIIM